MFEGTPIEIGMASTAIALVMAILSAAFAALGVWLRRPSFQAVSRRALYVNVPLVVLAFAVLVYAFIAKDFSVAYVAQNSNSRLPLLYRATATWGAHEGSLLLWLLYLVVFSALAARLHRDTHPLSGPWITMTPRRNPDRSSSHSSCFSRAPSRKCTLPCRRAATSTRFCRTPG